ncbi:hypothetical protein ACQEU8_00645 [Streptomyces sp. CA-250714]|uniref:hypothetical protein n=1 Tax=Streptomyces sp. CA-250714 TaxID=3240060 RepID=UPI003D8F1063
MRKMNTITRQAGLVTALAALAGTMVGMSAGTASAAIPSYDLQVCNATSDSDVELTHSDSWASRPFAEVPRGNPCTKFKVKTGEGVYVRINNDPHDANPNAKKITKFAMPRSSFKVWVGGSFAAPRWDTVEL